MILPEWEQKQVDDAEERERRRNGWVKDGTN